MLRQPIGFGLQELSQSAAIICPITMASIESSEHRSAFSDSFPSICDSMKFYAENRIFRAHGMVNAKPLQLGERENRWTSHREWVRVREQVKNTVAFCSMPILCEQRFFFSLSVFKSLLATLVLWKSTRWKSACKRENKSHRKLCYVFGARVKRARTIFFFSFRSFRGNCLRVCVCVSESVCVTRTRFHVVGLFGYWVWVCARASVCQNESNSRAAIAIITRTIINRRRKYFKIFEVKKRKQQTQEFNWNNLWVVLCRFPENANAKPKKTHLTEIIAKEGEKSHFRRRT